jgi:hypothetical protein
MTPMRPPCISIITTDLTGGTPTGIPVLPGVLANMTAPGGNVRTFGMVRYMNAKWLTRTFDMNRYLKKVRQQHI